MMIEQRKGIREPGALTEQEAALDLVGFNCVNPRHDEERQLPSEELLCGRNVIQDVPFWLRRAGRRVAKIGRSRA